MLANLRIIPGNRMPIKKLHRSSLQSWPNPTWSNQFGKSGNFRSVVNLNPPGVPVPRGLQCCRLLGWGEVCYSHSKAHAENNSSSGNQITVVASLVVAGGSGSVVHWCWLVVAGSVGNLMAFSNGDAFQLPPPRALRPLSRASQR